MSEASPRRLSMIDCFVLIAATAVAFLPASEIWPEAYPVFGRLPDDLSAQGWAGIFGTTPSSGWMDSIGAMGMYTVAPMIGVRFGALTHWAAVEYWVDVQTHGGTATGYAAAQDAYLLLFPFLTWWSIALYFLRLRMPRPEPRRLWRQPGWWAVLSAMAAIVVGSAVEGYAGVTIPSLVGPAAVVLAWLALAASWQWSAEKSWIDRMGRCLGIGWIGLIPLYVAGFMMM